MINYKPHQPTKIFESDLWIQIPFRPTSRDRGRKSWHPSTSLCRSGHPAPSTSFWWGHWWQEFLPQGFQPLLQTNKKQKKRVQLVRWIKSELIYRSLIYLSKKLQFIGTLDPKPSFNHRCKPSFSSTFCPTFFRFFSGWASVVLGLACNAETTRTRPSSITAAAEHSFWSPLGPRKMAPRVGPPVVRLAFDRATQMFPNWSDSYENHLFRKVANDNDNMFLCFWTFGDVEQLNNVFASRKHHPLGCCPTDSGHRPNRSWSTKVMLCADRFRWPRYPMGSRSKAKSI